jgi:hydroxyacylglutathione hydrolase
MSTLEILDNLFFIERGYLNCNHLVYRSPAPVLIDSAYIGDLAETINRIQHLGVKTTEVALHYQHPYPLRPYRRQSRDSATIRL